MNTSLTALLEKARHTHELSVEELVQLLSLPESDLPALMQAADGSRCQVPAASDNNRLIQPNLPLLPSHNPQVYQHPRPV